MDTSMLITAGILILVAAFVLTSVFYVADRMLNPILERICNLLRDGRTNTYFALLAYGRSRAYTDLMRRIDGPYRETGNTGELLANATRESEYLGSQAGLALWAFGRALVLCALLLAGTMALNEAITPSTWLVAKGVALYGFARISLRSMLHQ